MSFFCKYSNSHTNLAFCEKSWPSMNHLADVRLVYDNFFSPKSKCHIHFFLNKGPVWLCLHYFTDQNLMSSIQVVVIHPLWIFRKEMYFPFPWLLNVFVGRVTNCSVPSMFTTVDSDINSIQLAHFGSIITHLGYCKLLSREELDRISVFAWLLCHKMIHFGHWLVHTQS